MKNNKLLWILSVVLSIATIIDFIDGDYLKIITTLSLTLSVIFFSIGSGKINNKIFNYLGYILAAISFIGYLYRLIIWIK
ncbi:MAG: hypothetical protein IPJ79_07105 [Bacteroidetes bacterium]|nr:hypothetical protein [Bacteroidota bacterium]